MSVPFPGCDCDCIATEGCPCEEHPDGPAGVQVIIKIGGVIAFSFSIPFEEGVNSYVVPITDPLVFIGSYHQAGQRGAKHQSKTESYLACSGYADNYLQEATNRYREIQQAWEFIDLLKVYYTLSINENCELVGNIRADWGVQIAATYCDVGGIITNYTLWQTVDSPGPIGLAGSGCILVSHGCVSGFDLPPATYTGIACCPEHGCADPYFFTIEGFMYTSGTGLPPTCILEEVDAIENPCGRPGVGMYNCPSTVVSATTSIPYWSWLANINKDMCDEEEESFAGGGQTDWGFNIAAIRFPIVGCGSTDFDECASALAVSPPNMSSFEMIVKLYYA